MPYVGSNEHLNVVTGVTEIIPLTEPLEAEYNNKIFKANLLIWKESTGLLYLSDGVNSLAHLSAITDRVLDALNVHIDDTNLHIDADLKSRILSALENVSILSNTVSTLSDNVSTHINDSSIHVASNVISSTYATKQEVAALNTVYTTITDFNNHATDTNIHITAEDKALIASLNDNTSVTTADLDSMLVNLYS